MENKNSFGEKIFKAFLIALRNKTKQKMISNILVMTFYLDFNKTSRNDENITSHSTKEK